MGEERGAFTDESPGLLLSAAKVKFCQKDCGSRLRCLRLLIRRCRLARVLYFPKSSSQPGRRFRARSDRDAGPPQPLPICGAVPADLERLARTSAVRIHL